MPDEQSPLCRCGCGEAVTSGDNYAGGSEQEREKHRAVFTRRRAKAPREQQSRLRDAQSVLAELDLDQHAPAARVAQVLELQAIRLQRLCTVVAAELAAADVDERKRSEHALRSEHHRQMADVQQALDGAVSERQVAERTAFEQRAAVLEAQEGLRLVTSERDQAVRAAEQAVADRDRAHDAAADSEVAALRAQAAAEEAGQGLVCARLDFEKAVAAQDEAERHCADALGQAREQQLQTASVLAKQERRSSEALLVALREAERRATRERRLAVREVRETLGRENDRLRADLASLRDAAP